MPTRFLALPAVAVFGVLMGSAQEATAQDVDPQKAAACMQAAAFCGSTSWAVASWALPMSTPNTATAGRARNRVGMTNVSLTG